MMGLDESIRNLSADREEQRTEACGAPAQFWRLSENKFKTCK